jgi:hypothetical protein
MFRISSLLRGGLLTAAALFCSVPSLASAHNGGCFPTVTYCQPCYTTIVTPCYRPLVYSRPLFYTQPLVTQPIVTQPVIVQPYVKPIIVSPYLNGGYRVIVR